MSFKGPRTRQDKCGVIDLPFSKPVIFVSEKKQVKQVYNEQPLGILALGKIGGGYGSLVFMVSMVPGYGGLSGSNCGPWVP